MNFSSSYKLSGTPLTIADLYGRGTHNVQANLVQINMAWAITCIMS